MARRRRSIGGYYSGMPSREYWNIRAKESLAESFDSAAEIEEYFNLTYEKGLRTFVNKYRKMMEPFLLEDGSIDFNKLKHKLISDAAFAAKLKRITKEIDLFCAETGRRQNTKVEKLLNKVFKDTFTETCEGLGFSASGMEILNKSAISAAIKMPWTQDGREFSDVIWDNTGQMNRELRQLLSHSISTGESIDKTTKKMMKIFNKNEFVTRRVIRTETLATYCKASLSAYKECGIEYLEVLGEKNGDGACALMVGKKIKVNEARVGVNIPPAHPNCKCCIAPVVKK